MGYGGEENTEAALGGGWERDSGDEEIGGPGKAAVAPCSHIPWTLSALTDTHPPSL